MSQQPCSPWDQAMQHAFDAIVLLDAQGRVTAWNPQAEKCFGWQAHEIIGQALATSIFDGDQAAAFAREWQGVHQAHSHLVLPHFRAVHRTGHVIRIDLSLACTQNAAGSQGVVFIRDVSERLDADNALRVAAVAFQSLEGMVVMDGCYTILKVNQAFVDITGYEAHEAVGRVSALFRPGRQDEEVYLAMRSALPEKRFWQGEVWDRRKSGERYSVWLRVTAVLGVNQEVSHYVAAFVDISKQRASAQRVQFLDFHDPLTDLPNRRFFLDRLRQAMAAADRKSEHCVVLLLDVDEFKGINDTVGHHVGDALLKKIGKRLRMSLHAEDTIARLGGDEFAVILQGMATETQEVAIRARNVAERLVHALGLPFAIEQRALEITVSVGISVSCGTRRASEDLLKQADIAMYRAKSDGRNCIRFFATASQASLEARFALNAAMRSAFPQQFAVHYQLQVDAAQRPLGAEALLRWTQSDGIAVSPAQFIPLAEETGLILPMGLWVLQQACKQLQHWACEPTMRGLTLAVNVSARQFHAETFVRSVLDALAHSGANPNLLKLELTESLLLEEVDSVVGKMRALLAIGVRFSLDDFGTGYASLAYLKRFPFEQLKVDRSFIRDVTSDPDDAAIVHAILAMGQALRLNVVAEGVEENAQYDFLVEHGCRLFQGYLFGRPIPFAKFEATLLDPAATPD